jgi:hypothetical protein
MNVLFLKKLYYLDGDEIDNELFIFINDKTILRFADSVELEEFAKKLLSCLPEIRGEV